MMNTCKHDLVNHIKWAELELDYINSEIIAFTNNAVDLHVYIETPKLGDNEVYNNETLYELAERVGGDIVQVYHGNEEL